MIEHYRKTPDVNKQNHWKRKSTERTKLYWIVSLHSNGFKH